MHLRIAGYFRKSMVKCHYVNSFFFIDFISWWIISIHIAKALIKSHVLNFIRLKVSLCILRKRDVLVRKKNVSSSIIIRIRLRHNLTSVTYLKPKKLNPSKAWSEQGWRILFYFPNSITKYLYIIILSINIFLLVLHF